MQIKLVPYVFVSFLALIAFRNKLIHEKNTCVSMPLFSPSSSSAPAAAAEAAGCLPHCLGVKGADGWRLKPHLLPHLCPSA